MCGLCGVFGAEDHWTDAAGNAQAFAGAKVSRTRRHERQHRAALANKVLRHYGLGLRDWSGNAYVVGTQTGRSEIVDNLAQVWAAAERLIKRDCDPLDPALIAVLERD